MHLTVITVLDAVAEDVPTINLGEVHPMTGPVYIKGAKRGDALEVELLDIVPDEYGYTVIVPGFGFLRDLFTEPYIVNWKLTRTGAVSDAMPGVTIPYEAFPGSIGVLPGLKEIESWKEREADLAAAGGVVLHLIQVLLYQQTFVQKMVNIKMIV